MVPPKKSAAYVGGRNDGVADLFAHPADAQATTTVTETPRIAKPKRAVRERRRRDQSDS